MDIGTPQVATRRRSLLGELDDQHLDEAVAATTDSPTEASDAPETSPAPAVSR